MSDIVLTQYSGAILGPIARFLGWIMNGIYVGIYNLFGIESVVLSIVLITIIIYMCLLPLTIKQQKFSKLSQKMQPEIKAIQDKYKNRKDQESMMAMNQETQLVYEKYGVSATGSCLQMLIQMPILFALYRVFYNIPAYITSVKGSFTELVNGISQNSDGINTLASLLKDFNYTTSSGINANNAVDMLTNASASDFKNYVIDILYKLPSTGWEAISGSDYFPNLADAISTAHDHILNYNYFMGLNISDTPLSIIKTNFAAHSYGFIILALLIPVLSYLTQVLSMKLMPTANSNGNDQMAQQMRTMNLMMPLMSFIICFTVPVGLGFYWICSAVVRIVQQFFINKHIENLDLDDIIKKNQEKAKKKREKRGIYENQIREAAAIKTKSISSKANSVSKSDAELDTGYSNDERPKFKEGSMAAKANMVKDFNERNSRK